MQEPRPFFLITRMRTHTLLRSAWRNALFLTILGVLWILFAPRQLGGQVSYVIINGTSMLPGFHKGDLVLVRKAAEYPVGTIVTYQNPTIGPVIHRIIGRDGPKYVMKGDNNNWVDGYKPVIEEIFGGFWMHLPGAGAWAIRLRSPLYFSLLAGFGTLLLGLTMQTSPQPKKRFQQQTVYAAKAAVNQINRWAVSWREGMYSLVFILGLAGGLLLIFSFTRPVSRQSTLEFPLTQTGVYAYGASVPPGVYDQNRLDSGDAIFPQLNCTVEMFFNYTLTSQKNAQVEGTHHLIAQVSDTKGWKHSIELEKETPFSGSKVETSGALDVCAAQQIIADMQKATGVLELQYQLAIYPQVQVKGSLGAFAFQDQFNEPLTFVMEPHQIYLLLQSAGKNGLTQTQAGLVSGRVTVDNTLPLLSLMLPVRAARILGLAALLLAGLAFWWVEETVHKAEARDAREKIAHQLGRPPVRIQCAAFTGREVTALGRLEDLIALAQQMGLPVLYAEQDGQYSFFIETGAVVYHYQPLQVDA